MKTFWSDTHLIELFLSKKIEVSERLVFEAKIITSSMFKRKFLLQAKIHQLVKMYHRKKMKEDAETIYNSLVSQSHHQNFKDEIEKIFNH